MARCRAPAGFAPRACRARARALNRAIRSESPMAAILPILIFVIVIAALNLIDFHRVD
jgi:hypothetical protein